MTSDDQRLIQSMIDASQKKAQFSITKTPYHIHNGIDSPSLNIPTVGFSVIFGTSPALNSSYVVTITNPAITTSSTCIAVHCTAATDGSGNTGNISVFSQSAGSVTFVSDSTHDRSTLNYAIFNLA